MCVDLVQPKRMFNFAEIFSKYEKRVCFDAGRRLQAWLVKLTET